MDNYLAISALGALGQPTRLDAFRLLVQHEPGGMAAGEIARQLDVPANTLSTHLSILARAGLVRAERQSRSIIYRADVASLEPPAHPYSTSRWLAAESLGTALLLLVVIGSGIMGERLASGNVAIALLGNTLATGTALVVLITIFGPISGAHFNPAVTLAFAVRREIQPVLAMAYALTQTIGALGSGPLGCWRKMSAGSTPNVTASRPIA